jgi:hypothetical protein
MHMVVHVHVLDVHVVVHGVVHVHIYACVCGKPANTSENLSRGKGTHTRQIGSLHTVTIMK